MCLYYEDSKCAEEAIKEMNNKKLNNSEIIVMSACIFLKYFPYR